MTAPTDRTTQRDDEDILSLVRAFDSATLPKSLWTHRAHLTVATAAVSWFAEDEALRWMRKGIQSLNAAHGVPQTVTGGYHETLTRVYLRLVRHAAATARPGAPLSEVVRVVVDALGDRRIPLEYYSEGRLMSWEARTAWMEPDLHPLP